MFYLKKGSKSEKPNFQTLVIRLKDVLMFPAAKIHIQPKIIFYLNTLIFFNKISFLSPQEKYSISLPYKLSSLLTGENCQQKSILFYLKFRSHINSSPLLQLAYFGSMCLWDSTTGAHCKGGFKYLSTPTAHYHGLYDI